MTIQEKMIARAENHGFKAYQVAGVVAIFIPWVKGDELGMQTVIVSTIREMNIALGY